uniref:Glutathione peroxidase n=1 Tax=Amphilophus citrinellus TaxID=61819 RepID=A0A3Q0T645_AMPCI
QATCQVQLLQTPAVLGHLLHGLVSDVGIDCQTSMANKSVYDFSAETLDGQPVPLGNYRGKVLLIVNVATF